jgi:hypothetical protein
MKTYNTSEFVNMVRMSTSRVIEYECHQHIGTNFRGIKVTKNTNSRPNIPLGPGLALASMLYAGSTPKTAMFGVGIRQNGAMLASGVVVKFYLGGCKKFDDLFFGS